MGAYSGIGTPRITCVCTRTYIHVFDSAVERVPELRSAIDAMFHTLGAFLLGQNNVPTLYLKSHNKSTESANPTGSTIPNVGNLPGSFSEVLCEVLHRVLRSRVVLQSKATLIDERLDECCTFPVGQNQQMLPADFLHTACCTGGTKLDCGESCLPCASLSKGSLDLRPCEQATLAAVQKSAHLLQRRRRSTHVLVVLPSTHSYLRCPRSDPLVKYTSLPPLADTIPKVKLVFGVT